ncbi:hypothetical protein BCR39DRAFT_561627 [Naematelia encephala]|uniref:Uncharacterized protein n=1 Tax=Naematelia encephala TaxID=71784 RepID=A0A1Y2API5_9TREE|nr:hypothetical protein BCR39DRAFT_561627 [Naematelia encephala]
MAQNQNSIVFNGQSYTVEQFLAIARFLPPTTGNHDAESSQTPSDQAAMSDSSGLATPASNTTGSTRYRSGQLARLMTSRTETARSNDLNNAIVVNSSDSDGEGDQAPLRHPIPQLANSRIKSRKDKHRRGLNNAGRPAPSLSNPGKVSQATVRLSKRGMVIFIPDRSLLEVSLSEQHIFELYCHCQALHLVKPVSLLKSAKAKEVQRAVAEAFEPELHILEDGFSWVDDSGKGDRLHETADSSRVDGHSLHSLYSSTANCFIVTKSLRRNPAFLDAFYKKCEKGTDDSSEEETLTICGSCQKSFTASTFTAHQQVCKHRTFVKQEPIEIEHVEPKPAAARAKRAKTPARPSIVADAPGSHFSRRLGDPRSERSGPVALPTTAVSPEGSPMSPTPTGTGNELSAQSASIQDAALAPEQPGEGPREESMAPSSQEEMVASTGATTSQVAVTAAKDSRRTPMKRRLRSHVSPDTDD